MMKKQLLLSICIFLAFTTKAQWVNIPDSNFGWWLQSNFPNCVTGNYNMGYQIDTTCNEVISTQSISIDNIFMPFSISGIEYFDSLRFLDVSSVFITELKKLPNQLEYLTMSSSIDSAAPFNLPPNLKSFTIWGVDSNVFLPSLPNKLIEFRVNFLQIDSLPLLPSSIRTLNIANCNFSKLTHINLDSIEVLTCIGNPIDTIEINGNSNIKELHCGVNNYTFLKQLPTNIKKIEIEYTRLQNENIIQGLQNLEELTISTDTFLLKIPKTANSLKKLIIQNCTLIDSVVKLSSSLEMLMIFKSNVSYIDSFPNTLKFIEISNSNLQTVPKIPLNVESLNFEKNNIDSIQRFDNYLNLKGLYIPNNNLTTINGLPPSLLYFDCSNNNLTILDSLPELLMLLYCHNNNINAINDFHGYLSAINVSNNPISCLPQLYDSIFMFYINNTNINCLPHNFVFVGSWGNFDVNPTSLQFCNGSNNCSYDYRIKGNTHVFTGVNCTSDTFQNSTKLAGIKVLLYNMNDSLIEQTYANQFGEYVFNAKQKMQYKISIDTNSTSMKVVCPSVLYHIVDTANYFSFDNNFAFDCKQNTIGDYYLSIYADRFRNAIPTVVQNNLSTYIGNYCDSTMSHSGIVTTTFSGAVQYVSPAPNALTPIVSGNTLTYTIPNLDSLKEGDLDFVLLTDTNAPIGSQVCITSIIHSDSVDVNPSNDTLAMCFTVGNSFDPNEKSVYPKTISTDGDWLTYTIQFQNTGNDTAYTIVVKDTLPQELQVESFEYLASSHKNIIQIKDNEVTFTFPKINLVDSMTNEPLSHGWVQFKIRTKNNLPPVFNIANRAAIYFDFNAPIFTNYALTTQPTGIREVKENQFSVFPNPTKNLLQIHSKERGEYTATIIDLTGRILHSASFTDNTAIELSAYSTGIYSLILQDKNGNRNAVKVVKE